MAGREGQPSFLRILALDGGGVRGLSSLFILRELMIRIAIRTGKKVVRPCEYFELIIGTGTGGISALFLGRMRMSADQAIQEYIHLAETAFKSKSARIPRLLPSQTAPLDGAVLEEAIGEIVQRVTGDRDAPFSDREDSDETCCRTVVLAATTHNVDAPPYIFQSHADDTSPASGHIIRDVARATSSTGGLFEPVTLGHPSIQFTNAGTVGYNNPSEIALRVAERLWPKQPVNCIVSLGTGLQNIISLDNKKSRIADACRLLVQNCEQVHNRLQHSLHGKVSYFRFNVDRGLDSVDIMEWRQAGPRGALLGITNSYMRWEEVDVRLNSCVNAIRGDKTVTTDIPNHLPMVPELQEHIPQRVEHPDAINLLPMFNPASGLQNNPGETITKRDHREIKKFLPTFNTRPEIFYGRYSDIEKAASVLQDNGSARIAILGAGGIGKTSIALTLFHDPRVEEKFRSHRRFLACESINSPSQLVATLCAAVGLDDGSENGLEELLYFLNEKYASRPLLIVLDNFETVWDVEDARIEAERIIRGLGSVPLLSMVLTMRGAEQPVGIRWSLVLHVSPLDSDAARSTFIDVRSRDHVDDEHLDDLLQAVDYVPLAVTLMARLGQNESPKTLLKRWEVERTRLLSRPQDKDRSNSVDVSIDISINSYRMKSNPEALRLLSVISVLPYGVFIGDLPFVCRRILNRDEMSATLREVGLAYYDAASTLRVVSPIRLYTLRHHTIPPELLEDVRSFYFTLPHHAVLREQQKSRSGLNPASSDVVANTFRNASNIEAVITDALTLELETGRQEHQMSIAAAINWTAFIRARRPCSTIIELGLRVAQLRLERCQGLSHSYSVGFSPDFSADQNSSAVINVDAVAFAGPRGDVDVLVSGATINYGAAPDRLPSRKTTRHNPFEIALPPGTPRYHASQTVAECLFNLGGIQVVRGDWDAAKVTLCEARNIYQSVNNEIGAAQCLHGLGHIYVATHRLGLAREAYTKVAGVFRISNDRKLPLHCELAIGYIEHLTGNHDIARATFVKIRDKLVHEKDFLGIGLCLYYLGRLQQAKSEFEPARDNFTEAVALFKAVDHRKWLADCLLHLASAQRSMAEWDAAITTVTQAQEIFKRLDHKRGVVRTTRCLAQIQWKKGDLNAAKEGMARVAKAFETLDNSQMVAVCHLDLANIYMETTEYDAAREALTEASARFQVLNDEKWIAHCHMCWGRLQMKTHELDLARESFNNALQYFQSNSDSRRIADCLWDLGNVHYCKSECEIAREFFVKALETSDSINYRARAGLCLLSLGTVLRLTGNNTSAREMLERARQGYEAVHDQRGVATALDSLVTFARKTGDYEYAQESIVQAKRAFEVLDNHHGMARTSWQLAETFIGKKDYAGARDALADSRRKFEILKDPIWLATCDLCWGRLDRLGGKLDAAEKMILKAQDVFKANHYCYGVADSSYNLGNIYRKRLQYKTAIRFLSEALQTYTSLGRRGWMGECLLDIGHAERAMGRYDSARSNYAKAREHFEILHDDSRVELCLDELESISPSTLQSRRNSGVGASDRPKGVLTKIKAD